MRYKNLLITNFAITFAKGSGKPIQSLMVKIGGAFVIVFSLSQLLAKMLQGASLPNDVPLRIILVMVTGLAFFISGFAFLVTQSIQGNEERSFTRVTRLMPIPQVLRYILQLSPSILVIFLFVVLGFSALRIIATGIQQPFVMIECCWVLGSLSGLGMIHLRWLHSKILKLLFFATVLSSVVVGIEKIYESDQNLVVNYLAYVLLGILIFPTIGLIHQFTYGYMPHRNVTNQTYSKLLPDVMPLGTWFAVKLWRNPQSRSSFFATITMSCLLAMAIFVRHKVFADIYPVLLCSSLLAATFCTEIRGLMRRYMPPEAVLISGFRSLVSRQLLTLYTLGLCIGLPLLLSINGQVANSFSLISVYMVMQAFGVAAGQLVSAMLVPSSGEVGTQFFATLLAGSLVVLFPKYTHLADRSLVGSMFTWLVGASVASFLIYVVELIRRKNYGRTR